MRILLSLRPPIFVRRLIDAERSAVEAGLRSTDAFTFRRCQIVQTSADRVSVPQVARSLGCNDQTMRNAVHAFNADGVGALARGSSVAHTIHRAFAAGQAERLRALLLRSPRDIGHPTSRWTLPLAAQEACRQGLSASELSGETIRASLVRLGGRRRRPRSEGVGLLRAAAGLGQRLLARQPGGPHLDPRPQPPGQSRSQVRAPN